jgi:hypothetical protein
MTSFFNAFRLSRKKTSSVNDPTATNSPTDCFTHGMAFEQMCHDQPHPTLSPSLNNTYRLDDAFLQFSLAAGESHNGPLGMGLQGGFSDESTAPTYSVVNGYVTFTRDPSSFSLPTKQRASALKLKMDLFYRNSVDFETERNRR